MRIEADLSVVLFSLLLDLGSSHLIAFVVSE
jgi:hypothetical protein